MDLLRKYCSNEDRKYKLNNLNAKTKAIEMSLKGYNKHLYRENKL